MDDGSHLAFFEVPDAPFEFKAQHDFDLHIAPKSHKTRSNRCAKKGTAGTLKPVASRIIALFNQSIFAIRTAT
jgi:hypothetical protein